MRIIGKRKIRPIQFYASSALFVEGCMFNEQIHKLPSGSDTGMIKGVYRFKNHEEANFHWDKCLADKMSRETLTGE